MIGLIAFVFIRNKLYGPSAAAPANPANYSYAPPPPVVAPTQQPTGPVFPKEDQAAYDARINWWKNPASGQTAGDKKKDEFPDMFAEGRARLDEEEREHRLPKH